MRCGEGLLYRIGEGQYTMPSFRSNSSFIQVCHSIVQQNERGRVDLEGREQALGCTNRTKMAPPSSYQTMNNKRCLSIFPAHEMSATARSNAPSVQRTEITQKPFSHLYIPTKTSAFFRTSACNDRTNFNIYDFPSADITLIKERM